MNSQARLGKDGHDQARRARAVHGMNLDALLAAARKRLHEWINRSVAQKLRRLREKQHG